MISILIPTHNYNAYPLVNEVHKQAVKLGIDFEILVYDDASTQKIEANDLLQNLEGVTYKYFDKNLGRVPMLAELYRDAKYDMVLAFDVDVFFNDRFYLRKLLEEIDKVDADLYYGGTSVPASCPSPDKILRWKFGKQRESPDLAYRKAHPYNTVVCQSITVKRDVFLEFLPELMGVKDYYGLDIYFTYLLKKAGKKIHHFQNPVTHLGFDANASLLQKTKSAIDTYRHLYGNGLIDRAQIKLVSFAEKYSKFGLCPLLRATSFVTLPLIKRNLLSKNPSLTLFDIYKLIYYCQIKSRK